MKQQEERDEKLSENLARTLFGKEIRFLLLLSIPHEKLRYG